MPEIRCPNCLKDVGTEVRNPVAVVCNGHGEHVVSAEPMDRTARQSMLTHMNHTIKTSPTDGIPPYHLVSGVSGKHIGPFSTTTDALLARYIAGPEFQAAEVMDNIAFDRHLSDMGSDRGRV